MLRGSDEERREAGMGYQSRVQVIQRGGKNRQYYLICPAPLAQALEIEKGEIVEWVVEDKHTLLLKRTAARRATTSKRRSRHVE